MAEIIEFIENYQAAIAWLMAVLLAPLVMFIFGKITKNVKWFR